MNELQQMLQKLQDNTPYVTIGGVKFIRITDTEQLLEELEIKMLNNGYTSIGSKKRYNKLPKSGETFGGVGIRGNKEATAESC